MKVKITVIGREKWVLYKEMGFGFCLFMLGGVVIGISRFCSNLGR